MSITLPQKKKKELIEFLLQTRKKHDRQVRAQQVRAQQIRAQQIRAYYSLQQGVASFHTSAVEFGVKVCAITNIIIPGNQKQSF